MSFTAAHRLREQEDGRTRARTTQMPERAVHPREHAGGEKVLVEKLRTIDLSFEQCVEAEHRGCRSAAKTDGRGLQRAWSDIGW